jgi:hypothetical protein
MLKWNYFFLANFFIPLFVFSSSLDEGRSLLQPNSFYWNLNHDLHLKNLNRKQYCTNRLMRVIILGLTNSEKLSKYMIYSVFCNLSEMGH